MQYRRRRKKSSGSSRVRSFQFEPLESRLPYAADFAMGQSEQALLAEAIDATQGVQVPSEPSAATLQTDLSQTGITQTAITLIGTNEIGLNLNGPAQIGPAQMASVQSGLLWTSLGLVTVIFGRFQKLRCQWRRRVLLG